MKLTPVGHILVLGVFGALLSGCVTLLPSHERAQLYRFADPRLTPAVPPSPNSAAVALVRGSFPAAAEGDGILTVQGNRAAYIAKSRWVAPASVLFEQAVVAAFATESDQVRLTTPQARPRNAFELRLDVRSFEARYLGGLGGAPTAFVGVRATLTDSNRAFVAQQMFNSSVPASENRVGSIVAAYSQALSKVLSEVVAWTAARSK